MEETNKDRVRINKKILNSSLNRNGREKKKLNHSKNTQTLPPLKLALDQYDKIKKRNMSYHNESFREETRICMTIRELDELCSNTRRYCKTDRDRKYFLNNNYFSKFFSMMNSKKLQLYNKA